MVSCMFMRFPIPCFIISHNSNPDYTKKRLNSYCVFIVAESPVFCGKTSKNAPISSSSYERLKDEFPAAYAKHFFQTLRQRLKFALGMPVRSAYKPAGK
jgi:hypothetical protein